MKIEVMAKNIYGKIRFYPISKDAKILANISDSPSLSKRQMNICKDAGWEISISHPEINLENYLKQ